MSRLRRAVPLLIALGAVFAARAALFDLGFWRDDFGMLERVERLGCGEAVLRGFTRRYLEFVNDFWRPVATAVYAAGAEVLGTRPFLWRLVGAALLAWGGLSAYRLLSRRAPGARAASAAAVAALLLTPAVVEPFVWSVAGQQDLLAFAMLMAALDGFVRGSAFSPAFAALACGSKESAFVLPAVLAAALFAFVAPADRRARLRLFAVHVGVAALLFGARAYALGGLRTPYSVGSGRVDDFFGGALRGAAEGLPRLATAAFAAVGPTTLVFAAVGLVVAAASRRFVAVAATALAAGACAAPLVLLPLAGLEPGGGYRYFVPVGALLVVFSLRGWLGDDPSPRRARVAALCAALAAVGAWRDARYAEGVMTKTVAASARALAAVDAVPGPALLVAGAWDETQWAFPPAARPPFATPGRRAYPLRRGTDAHETLLHLRPHGDDFAVVQITGRSAFLCPPVPLDGRDAPAGLRLRPNPDASFELVPHDPPLRALPWIRLRGPRGAAASVRTSWTHPDGFEWGVELKIPVDPDVDAVVPLCDLAGFPTARCGGLSVVGATAARLGPPPPLRMRLVRPTPRQELTPLDALAPLEFEGLPEGARALRFTLHTGGGGMDFVMLGTRTTFAAISDASGGLFAMMCDAALRMAADVVYLGVEALADPALPFSVLDRTPVEAYRLAWAPL